MKNTIKNFAALLTVGLMLVSCTETMAQPNDTDVGRNNSSSSEFSTVFTPEYAAATDIDTYMRYLPQYFSDKYATGDALDGALAADLAFQFAFYNRGTLDFVKIDEDKFTIEIAGDDFRGLVKVLTGTDAAEESLNDSGYMKYDAASDVYSTSYAREFVGNGYRYAPDRNADVVKSETESTLSVTTTIAQGPMSSATPSYKRVTYSFDKAVYKDFLYYRLTGVEVLGKVTLDTFEGNSDGEYTDVVYMPDKAFENFSYDDEVTADGIYITYSVPNSWIINPPENHHRVDGPTLYKTNASFIMDESVHNAEKTYSALVAPLTGSVVTKWTTDQGYDCVTYSSENGDLYTTYSYIRFSDSYIYMVNMTDSAEVTKNVLNSYKFASMGFGESSGSSGASNVKPDAAVDTTRPTESGMHRISYSPGSARYFDDAAQVNQEGIVSRFDVDDVRIEIDIPENWYKPERIDANVIEKEADGHVYHSVMCFYDMFKLDEGYGNYDTFTFDENVCHRTDGTQRTYYPSANTVTSGTTKNGYCYVAYTDVNNPGYSYVFVQISDGYIATLRFSETAENAENIMKCVDSIYAYIG